MAQVIQSVKALGYFWKQVVKAPACTGAWSQGETQSVVCLWSAGTQWWVCESKFFWEGTSTIAACLELLQQRLLSFRVRLGELPHNVCSNLGSRSKRISRASPPFCWDVSSWHNKKDACGEVEYKSSTYFFRFVVKSIGVIIWKRWMQLETKHFILEQL